MSNLLRAIKLIIGNPIITIDNYHSNSENRVNSVGEALENYIKDIFSNSFGLSESEKMLAMQTVFSYLGNQNNPPDMMLRGGDAIEIKKIQSPIAALALNSSYPKLKLQRDSPMISQDCKNSEDWIDKDLLYIIGHINHNSIKYLFFVYGDCFCANKEIYEKIKNTISNGINQIESIEFTETKELGKVKKIDPLGITDLRIRGMWHIDNPIKIFNYLQPIKNIDSKNFKLICLMQDNKFNSFPEEEKDFLLKYKHNNYSFNNVRIKNPNNPAQLLNCKLITYFK